MIRPIKAVLPGMRARRSGRIVNVTSMGGFITMPGIAYYCGSKFALEGISEALGKEVKPLGIHVTALAPGQFRTDWAGRSMIRAERNIADYDAVMDPIRAARQAKSGNQPGDPAKAAQALLKLVAAENPPVRLYLGADALKLVEDKIEAMKAEIAAWEEVSRSTDFGSCARSRLLEDDPEKWVPVFRKDHAQIKEIERDDDSRKSHPAPGARP